MLESQFSQLICLEDMRPNVQLSIMSGVVIHAFIPNTRETEAGDFGEFKTASSQAAKATETTSQKETK